MSPTEPLDESVAESSYIDDNASYSPNELVEENYSFEDTFDDNDDDDGAEVNIEIVPDIPEMVYRDEIHIKTEPSPQQSRIVPSATAPCMRSSNDIPSRQPFAIVHNMSDLLREAPETDQKLERLTGVRGDEQQERQERPTVANNDDIIIPNVDSPEELPIKSESIAQHEQHNLLVRTENPEGRSEIPRQNPHPPKNNARKSTSVGAVQSSGFGLKRNPKRLRTFQRVGCRFGCCNACHETTSSKKASPRKNRPQKPKASTLNNVGAAASGGSTSNELNTPTAAAANAESIECVCGGDKHNSANHRCKYGRYIRPENYKICDICGASLHKRSLMRHKIVKHQLKIPKNCNICTRRFSTIDRLKQHKPHCGHTKAITKFRIPALPVRKSAPPMPPSPLKKQSTTETAMQSTTPSQLTPSTPVMTNSVPKLSSHDQIPMVVLNRVFVCHVCKSAHSTHHSLEEHIRLNHLPDGVQLKCEPCGLPFTHQSTLDAHCKRSHSTNRAFICSICKKGFKSRNLLRGHQYVHTGQKTFKCVYDGCERLFSTIQNRNWHMRAHKQKENYVCQADGCGLRFTYAIELKRHEVTKHNISMTTLSCTICHQIYFKKWQLSRHMKKHDAETPRPA